MSTDTITITIAGPAGSGKSTIAAAIHVLLADHDFTHIHAIDPEAPPRGEEFGKLYRLDPKVAADTLRVLGRLDPKPRVKIIIETNESRR